MTDLRGGGTLHVVGMGPGDPELLTLKAARVLAAAPVVAFFAKRGEPGHARTIAAGHLRAGAEELRLDYPMTTELAASDPAYGAALAGCYARAATMLGARLAAGQDVALLCEGDPLFYGSAIHLIERLAAAHPIAVIPGVSGMSGAWSAAGLPMVRGDAALAVLPATLPEDALAARLAGRDAAVILKLGRNLPRVRAALARAGRTARALYVERGTMAAERILPLAALDDEAAPYFSLVLVPAG
jgi:precorrin-2/cobalt-factor-2 C20-methyltransferase